MTVVGYARVSTDGQTLDAQLVALREAGAERVFSEKQSGAKCSVGAMSGFAGGWRYGRGDEAGSAGQKH
jgi:DNA invertase Pin-like site-specific DNA recombinase